MFERIGEGRNEVVRKLEGGGRDEEIRATNCQSEL